MGSGGKAVGKRLLRSREAMGAGRTLASSIVSPIASPLLPNRHPHCFPGFLDIPYGQSYNRAVTGGGLSCPRTDKDAASGTGSRRMRRSLRRRAFPAIHRCSAMKIRGHPMGMSTRRLSLSIARLKIKPMSLYPILGKRLRREGVLAFITRCFLLAC